MFQVGTAIEFSAQHIMPGVEGPEGQLHSHDYRLDVVVERETARRSRDGLRPRRARGRTAAHRLRIVRGKNLEVIRPADADAVTVEVFARWAHDYLADAIRDSGAQTLSVRVWENSMSFGGYSDQLR